jgi:hypothetical protein
MARRRTSEPTANPARGAALVVIAVVIGLILLRNGLDTSETVTPSTTDGSSIDLGDDGGETDGTETDEGADSTDGGTEARPPSQVPAIVLNGSGVQGAASTYSTALRNLGYILTDDDGANATSNVTATQVLYATTPSSFQAEAIAVAQAIGASETAVAPLGTTTPGTISGAAVVVVLGPDLANQDPPAAAGAGTAG